MAKQYNYFDALLEMTDYSCQAARYFNNVINNFDPETLQEKIRELHQIEHSADEKRHEIMNKLAKEFLPPIEREDIAELAAKIDDITDCIDDILQHMYIYNVKTLLPECKEFSGLILKCCESVFSVAQEFGRFRKSATIRDNIIYTNQLESEGDKLYAKIMHNIFISDKMSVKDIFIWARIVTSFEDCCDYCEDVSELFESAIMKNS